MKLENFELTRTRTRNSNSTWLETQIVYCLTAHVCTTLRYVKITTKDEITANMAVYHTLHAPNSRFIFNSLLKCSITPGHIYAANNNISFTSITQTYRGYTRVTGGYMPAVRIVRLFLTKTAVPPNGRPDNILLHILSSMAEEWNQRKSLETFCNRELVQSESHVSCNNITSAVPESLAR